MPGLIAYAYDKGEFSADSPVNQYENVEVDYKGYVSFILSRNLLDFLNLPLNLN